MKKSGFKNMYFAWIGSLENNKPHYYMIHSPEFLIEYDNVGFQNDGNHIHAIFRETGNDFGEDILKQHYSESHK
jgi:TFIIF-interacting CTD phosphatase-like protein